MTNFGTIVFRSAALAAIATASLLSGNAANARGKEVFVQDYKFAKPMHGYSGHSGNYYCDYQRLPNRKCVSTPGGGESCKIVSWTLREMCQ
ncbi:hypothetical protein DLM45_13910 [Hyphomicrobium methylovorum]|uniref:hypothetical protein n=1 Tax=Hyphomicrobium methylovorum TaxID=84 RepID=UPI0015E77F91|nr:hypothetical protein [Hyphomicrobium methylovorum]MBA2127311.1 hypothetical protein [Hyphomicrobium methylovorum]